MDFNNFGLRGRDLIAANLQAQARAGVTVVRDMGSVLGARLPLPVAVPGMRVISAGHFLAPAGGFHAGLYQPVPAAELVAAAVREAEAGAQWVKLIGDFPGADGNWWLPQVNYAPELVAEVVEAVHRLGARVAVHTTGPVADLLVAAGVDSVEHGPGLTGAGVAEMARRGTLWTPTVATGVYYAGMAARGSGPVAEAARASLPHWRGMIELGARLGVTILAGSDELPTGSLAGEVRTLHEFGLAPAQALAAASTAARNVFGLPGIEEGAPADLVLFERDPRTDLAVLAEPALVLLGGHRLR